MGEWTYGNQVLIPSDFFSILGLRDNAINWTKKKSITGKEEARNTLHVPDDIY